MPSAFFPIKLAYEEANLLGIDDEDFDRALFSKLASGSISAQSEQGLRSNLAFNRFDNLDVAAAKLGFSTMNKGAIASAIKLKKTAHIFTSIGLITVEPGETSFTLGIETDSEPLSGPEILPPFWDDAYLTRASQTLISMDWHNETRSTFLRVAINIKDFRNSGLLTPSRSDAPKGRPNTYDDPVSDKEFLDWLRINPQMGTKRRIFELREIYQKNKLELADDKEGFRAEKRKIAKLLASVAGPK